jgi:hypothetical protein
VKGVRRFSLGVGRGRCYLWGMQTLANIFYRLAVILALGWIALTVFAGFTGFYADVGVPNGVLFTVVGAALILGVGRALRWVLSPQ